MSVPAIVRLPALSSLSDQSALHTAHYFSPTANWLIPKHVIQGRNPTSGRGSSLERVRAIREQAACNTFVCLQAEIAPQDGGESFGGADDWRTNPMPGFDSYFQDAKAVVPEPPIFLHFGIKDFEPADSLAELARFVDLLANRILAGEVLYIHCWGGKGRAGIVSACLLGALYENIDAEEALERVQSYVNLRKQGIGVKLKSPETEHQKQQVRDYFYVHLKRK